MDYITFMVTNNLKFSDIKTPTVDKICYRNINTALKLETSISFQKKNKVT